MVNRMPLPHFRGLVEEVPYSDPYISHVLCSPIGKLQNTGQMVLLPFLTGLHISIYLKHLLEMPFGPRHIHTHLVELSQITTLLGADHITIQ